MIATCENRRKGNGFSRGNSTVPLIMNGKQYQRKYKKISKM